MSQSRSPGGLLAGMTPCVVQALQSVGPAAPAASCTSQHFVTAAWRINVAGRDSARGAQATSSQLCRHKAGLTLSSCCGCLLGPAARKYCIIVQSRYDDDELLSGTEYMCLTLHVCTCPCTRTCGTDHCLYSLLGSCGGTAASPLLYAHPALQQASASLCCRDPLRSGLKISVLVDAE